MPTQPSHPVLIVDVPSGYLEDLETFGTPDTVDITDILTVDVTPLTSISTSGMDVTSCPDMSVAASKSVDLSTSMSVDFDDRTREIQITSATSLFVTDTIAGAHLFGNASPVSPCRVYEGNNCTFFDETAKIELHQIFRIGRYI